MVFKYLNHRDGRHQVTELETQAFIDRFAQHIPDKHFRQINFYGFLANRGRGIWLPKVYALLEQQPEPVRTIGYLDLHAGPSASTR